MENEAAGRMGDGSGFSFASIADASQRLGARVELSKVKMGVLTLFNGWGST